MAVYLDGSHSRDYHCSKYNINIVSKYKICNETYKCSDCPFMKPLDRKTSAIVADVVKEGNSMVDSGLDRDSVLKQLQAKYSLDKKQTLTIKRQLKFKF